MKNCPTCGTRTLFDFELIDDATVATEIHKWIAFLETIGVSASHIRHLKTRTRLHISPVIGSMYVKGVTTRVVHDLYVTLIAKGLASKTIKHCLGVVSGLLNYLYELEEVERLPKFPKIRVTPRHEKKWLNKIDQRRILNEVAEKYVLFMEILFETGMRPGEARALKMKDIEGPVITVSRALDEGGKVKTTKTGKTYRYPITENLEQRLKAWYSNLLPEAFLFSHLSYSAIHRGWTAACLRAGFDIPMYEASRHSKASQVNAEVEVYRYERLRETLQHESASTTLKHYVLDNAQRVTV